MYRKTTPVWLALFADDRKARLRLIIAIYVISCAVLIGGMLLASLASHANAGAQHDAPASIDPAALTRGGGGLPLMQADILL